MQEQSPFVVVTGGLSGIGAAILDALVASGIKAIGLDIAASTTRNNNGSLIWPSSVDVADEDTVAAAVSGIENQHGPITGLVNAAGVLGKMHPPERLRMKDWDREVNIDLRGTYVMCRAVGPRMANRGHGAIVNIASIAGMTSGPLHAYGPAKAAVINLTMTLAAEWGPRNKRVNVISPGFTKTPALEAGFASGALDPKALQRLTALRRLVEPREIASTAIFLLSADASGITGVNLPVDAGFLASVTWAAYGVRRGE
jgi:NAD(P)-dependent dehydrogenase (short-subunit alcohol dehydrogenase family)